MFSSSRQEATAKSLPSHWRPPSDHAPPATFTVPSLLIAPLRLLLLLYYSNYYYYYYYYYFFSFKMSVMVFCQVCLFGGATQLFIYCLSQDWTFCARQQSLCWPIRTTLSVWCRRLRWDPQCATAVPGFVSASHSLSSENVVSSSLSRFSAGVKRRGALQVLSRGHSQWAWKTFLKWRHCLNLIHQPAFHFTSLSCVFCLNGGDPCQNVF